MVNSIATEVVEEVKLWKVVELIEEEILVVQIKWRSGQRDSNSQSSQRISRKSNPLDALSDEDNKLLHVEDSNGVFKFGDSKSIKSN